MCSEIKFQGWMEPSVRVNPIRVVSDVPSYIIEYSVPFNPFIFNGAMLQVFMHLNVGTKTNWFITSIADFSTNKTTIVYFQRINELVKHISNTILIIYELLLTHYKRLFRNCKFEVYFYFEYGIYLFLH